MLARRRDFRKGIDADAMTPTTPHSVAASMPLRSFSLELTKGCNLRCGYCYYAQREAAYDPKATMTPEVAEHAVERLVESGAAGEPFHVHLFGGEPLLVPGLVRHVVLYAERRAAEVGRPVSFEITTNGTRFSPETIDFLNEHRVHVGVSFDGPPEVQDIARPLAGGSSYQSALPGLRRFLASRNGTPLAAVTHASVVVTRRESDLLRIVRHLEDLGFPRVILTPATDLPGTSLGFRSEDLPELLRAYDALAADHETRLARGETPVDTWFAGLLARLVSGERKTAFCEGGRDGLGVAADGSVYLCYRFYENRDYAMGDVRQGVDRAVTERLLAEPVEARTECGRCWARYFCGGGCHHENLVSGGGLGSPNPVTCEVLRHGMGRTLEMWARLSRRGLVDGRRLERTGSTVTTTNEQPGFGDDSRPQRASELHVREIDDGRGGRERIVYAPQSHEVAVLNATASFIFDLCDGSHPVSEILASLRRRFPAAPPEVLQRDLLATLADLRGKSLVS